MDGTNGNNTKGNRFFLPKIEYSRLDSQSKLTPELELNKMRKDEESKRFESAPNTTDRPAVSFTKFSVLPPIRHNGTTRGKFLRDLEKARSDDQYDELEGRRRSSSLRRQPALWHGEREASTKINMENGLHIVGQKYSELSQSHLRRENDPLIARRPSSTPQISTLATTDIATAQNGDLQRIHRFTKFKRFHSESSKDKNPIPRDGASFISSTDNLTTLLDHVNDYKRKVSTSGLMVDFAPTRPVSRCHIDINVNDAKRTNQQNDYEKQQLSTKLQTNNPQHAMSINTSPKPSIEIYEESADNDNNNNNNNNNHNDMNSNSDNSPPSIQILIDTLETAKHEIPDKLELPKMSVREQRRRSALCRVNSKQVDDFLLVHNLKDLGLL